MKVTKMSETIGYLHDDGNTVRGLWLSDQASASNPGRLKMIIALLESKGLTVTLSDYAAVTRNQCVPKGSSPDKGGGYIVAFPSAGWSL